MLTFRYIFRLVVAFISRFKALLIIGVLFGIGAFFFIRFASPLLGKETERIGITGRFTIESLPKDILNLVGDGLTKIDDSGIVEPSLSSSWETPDKGKTWTFLLKEDIFWQDGKRVTSESINYQFSDVEIELPDDKTLIFKLQDAFSPFPLVVSRPIFKKGLLSTGEWKVTKASLAGNFVQSLVLVNQEGDKKIFKFYPTEERTKLAYKLGQVDTVINIFNPRPIDTWKTALTNEETNKNQVVAIFFNTQDPFVSDKTIRQALDYAIDKKVFKGERAISPISPNSWAYNPQVKAYSYDPNRVKELLGEIDGGEPVIKLVSSPVLLATAEKIADFWNAAGIKTVVQVSSVVPDEFQAYLAILDIPQDPDQYSVWHSTQTATNISNFQNPRIDKLLEDGRTELGLEARRKIYLDFQRFLVEELPAAFLYHPVTYTITRK